MLNKLIFYVLTIACTSQIIKENSAKVLFSISNSSIFNLITDLKHQF